MRLSELPTEYYHQKTLEIIGNKMGRLIKMDICTSATLRGLYARICVEVPIGIPVKKYINIENLKQEITYEGESICVLNVDMWSTHKSHVPYVKGKSKREEQRGWKQIVVTLKLKTIMRSTSRIV